MADNSSWVSNPNDPDDASKKDAWDRLTGKGAYYVAPSAASPSNTTQPAPVIAPIPPSPLVSTPTYVAPTGILQADPDIIVFDDNSVSPEYLTNAFFEEFGGTELISISRSDLIDGQDVSYSPIVNLSSIRQQYNPNNIIAIGILQDDLSKITIDLAKRGPHDPYFDSNGDLVVEIDIVNLDESIEVDIATNGTINTVAL